MVVRRVIYDTILNPLGEPQVGVEVTAKLVDAAFYKPDPSISIHPLVVSTRTNENGYWQLALIPNALLAPRGNYYIIKAGTKFYYVWIPADDTTPLPLSAVLVGEHDVCQTDLPGVAGVRVYGFPPITGVVTLKEGTEISLEQDYDNRAITIHGRKYVEGTEINIETVDLFTYRIHGRRIIGEQGIIVTPQAPYDRIITPDYGTEIQPIAAQSQTGNLDRLARVDHTHEGIHSINNLLGDIQLLADVGISLQTRAQDNAIAIANDPHQVLYGKHFEIRNLRIPSAVTTGIDWFNYDTQVEVPFTAIRTDTNQDVTSILTDNNPNTYIELREDTTPPVRVRLYLSRPMPIAQIRFLPYTNQDMFSVYFYLRTGDGYELAVATRDTGSGSDWQQLALFKNDIIADVIEFRKLEGGYWGEWEYPSPPPARLSEVRVRQGILFKAAGLMSGATTDPADVLFHNTVYLKSGFTYRFEVVFGCGDYISDAPTTNPEMYTQAWLYFPNGTTQEVLPWSGIPFPSIAPPYYNIIYIRTFTITPPVTGFAQLNILVSQRPWYSNFDHIYILGVIVRPAWI